MKIEVYTSYNEDEILRLYQSVGWKAYTSSPEKLRKGFENSLLTLAAYEGETLQGIIRAVGDGHTVVLIQDILVFPEYQRRESEKHCCRRFWINFRTSDRLNWQRIILQRQ